MNLLSFNKTNLNLIVIPFKEDKCTSSETQTCEEGRKKKERKKNLKNEERKKKRKDEYVGVGGKGSVCRKLQEIFFFFFGRYL